MQEKQKHKIAFFTNSMGIGGAERVISRIIPRLSEDYDISLILIDGSRIEYEIDVEIISLCESEKKNRVLYLFDLVSAAGKLKKIVREKKIECIISFLSIPNLLNILCCKRAKNIISIRGQLGADKDKGAFSVWKNKAEKALYKKADKIIIPSSMLGMDVQKQCSIIDSSKLKVIYNPIDKESILSLSEEDILDDYKKIFDENKIIVALGRMTPEKGYKYLLDSFSIAIKHVENVKLMIIGDGRLFKETKAYARTLNLEDKVIFTGNIVNPFPYLKRANLYIMSSVSEGFPNAMVEAMACGLPVVSTDCKSGPREILSAGRFDIEAEDIEDSDYGILCPSMGKEKACEYLAEAMKQMITNQDKRAYYAKQAVMRTDFFDIDKIVQEYRDTIFSVIE